MRKQVLGAARVKGIKSKIFVKTKLELIKPDVKKFNVLTKRGAEDPRNGDTYDAIICSLYFPK